MQTISVMSRFRFLVALTFLGDWRCLLSSWQHRPRVTSHSVVILQSSSAIGGKHIRQWFILTQFFKSLHNKNEHDVNLNKKEHKSTSTSYARDWHSLDICLKLMRKVLSSLVTTFSITSSGSYEGKLPEGIHIPRRALVNISMLRWAPRQKLLHIQLPY